MNEFQIKSEPVTDSPPRTTAAAAATTLPSNRCIQFSPHAPSHWCPLVSRDLQARSCILAKNSHFVNRAILYEMGNFVQFVT